MIRKWYILAFALLAFSYPATAILATMFELPLGNFNIALKAGFFAMFVLSLMASISRGRTALPSAVKPLLLFLLIYGLRLAYDVFLRDITPPDVPGFYIGGYFFLLTLLPAFTIALAYEPSDLPRLRKASFLVLFVSCASIVIYFFAELGTSLLDAMMQQRLEIRGEGELEAMLNPITVGLTGALLAIFSIAQLSIRNHLQRIEQMQSLIGLGLGVVCLLLSGSRGPLVALIMALIFYFLALTISKHTSSRYSRAPLSRSIQFLIGIGVSAAIYVAATSDTALLAVIRLIDTFADNGGRTVELRQLIYQDAINRFLDSPVSGDSYLVYGKAVYVHNAVLESFVATGLFGGLLFCFSTLIILISAWHLSTKLIGLDTLPWALAAIVSLAIAMFSKTLSQAPEVWLVAILAICAAGRSSDERARGGSNYRSGKRSTFRHQAQQTLR